MLIQESQQRALSEKALVICSPSLFAYRNKKTIQFNQELSACYVRKGIGEFV